MTTELVTITKPAPARFYRGNLERYYPELPDYITRDEAHAILDAALESPRDYLFFATLWNTGLRVSECLSITLEHVRGGDIRVRGKGGKIRYIPVKPSLVNDLLRYALDMHLDYQSRLFPITRSQAHRLINSYGLKAGIARKLHCHLLRHGYAINFLRQMPNLVYLQELLGHSSIETTRIYTRAALPDVREALEKVEM